MTNYCPACERGVLVPAVADEVFPFDGVQLTAQGIEFSECPVCGEEVVLEDQAKRNDIRFARKIGVRKIGVGFTFRDEVE